MITKLRTSQNIRKTKMCMCKNPSREYRLIQSAMWCKSNRKLLASEHYHLKSSGNSFTTPFLGSPMVHEGCVCFRFIIVYLLLFIYNECESYLLQNKIWTCEQKKITFSSLKLIFHMEQCVGVNCITMDPLLILIDWFWLVLLLIPSLSDSHSSNCNHLTWKHFSFFTP